MNIIVDDDDFPLIIKVASLPGARMQVYFLDNDDFFKRKSVLTDDEGEPFDDNSDRMIFFCKGVLETVKKFGWSPDIVHCHGWITGLVPLYLKTVYKNEPLFRDSKIVYSLYDYSLNENFSDEFVAKASSNALVKEDLDNYRLDDKISVHRGAALFSEGLIVGSEVLGDDVLSSLAGIERPTLEFKNEDEYLPAYVDFYKTLLV
jgi:starch synthase